MEKNSPDVGFIAHPFRRPSTSDDEPRETTIDEISTHRFQIEREEETDMSMSVNAGKGMIRILDGIMKYRRTLRPTLLEEFQKVINGPTPEGLLLTCVDSRVVASRLTQAAPGQLFFVRNPGNLVPNYSCFENETAVGGECGALELACVRNNVRVITVFGHSDCKAMNLLYSLRNEISKPSTSPLEKWLKTHAQSTVEQFQKLESSGDFKKKLVFASAQDPHAKFEAYIDPNNEFKPSDKLSQVNTLEQFNHFLTYPFLQERLKRKDLEVHALWTDIYKGEVYMFSFKEKCFVKIDEQSYEKLSHECK